MEQRQEQIATHVTNDDTLGWKRHQCPNNPSPSDWEYPYPLTCARELCVRKDGYLQAGAAPAGTLALIMSEILFTF